MTNEFKKLSGKSETRYVLEDGGSTTTGAVATVEKPLGELQRRTKPPETRNPVAKNASAAIGGGAAGAHKDKKKNASVPRKEKHKKPFMESESNVSDRELDTIDPQDQGEEEGSFVKNQIHTMLRVLTHLEHAIGDEEDLPEWVQMKLSQAQQSVVGVMNYMISEKEREVERQTGGHSLMKENANLDNLTSDEIKGIGMMIKDGYDISSVIRIFDNKPTKEQIVAIAMSNMDNGVAEGWSQKYKSSINCSHPKGFSQKAHCAGKKKHNESMMTMEMTCEDCGMCKTHGNLSEIKKGAKDSNGFTRCWPGKHAVGTKKGKNGGQVRNCKPNEDMEQGDSYMEALFQKLAEKIPKGASVDYYIKDFAKSTAPQFKNKNPAKRKQMAIAAWNDSKRKK